MDILILLTLENKNIQLMSEILFSDSTRAPAREFHYDCVERTSSRTRELYERRQL